MARVPVRLLTAVLAAATLLAFASAPAAAAPVHREVAGSCNTGDIVCEIEQGVIGFFQSIWNGISGFFGGIFGSIGNLFSNIFTAPINSINASWASLQGWASGFGPLSPLITVGIVVLVVVIVVFFLWLVIKLSVSEGEQTLGELEEGE